MEPVRVPPCLRTAFFGVRSALNGPTLERKRTSGLGQICGLDVCKLKMKTHEVEFCYRVITGSEVLHVAASWKSIMRVLKGFWCISKGVLLYLCLLGSNQNCKY